MQGPSAQPDVMGDSDACEPLEHLSHGISQFQGKKTGTKEVFCHPAKHQGDQHIFARETCSESSTAALHEKCEQKD